MDLNPRKKFVKPWGGLKTLAATAQKAHSQTFINCFKFNLYLNFQ